MGFISLILKTCYPRALAFWWAFLDSGVNPFQTHCSQGKIKMQAKFFFKFREKHMEDSIVANFNKSIFRIQNKTIPIKEEKTLNNK